MIEECENCEALNDLGAQSTGFACLYYEKMRMLEFFIAYEKISDAQTIQVIDAIVRSCFKDGKKEYPQFSEAIHAFDGIDKKIMNDINNFKSFIDRKFNVKD